MDPTTALLLLLAALFGAFSGLVIGAGLVWLLRPVQPPVVTAPLPPTMPVDPGLPEAMRKALEQAPDSFARARNGRDFRAEMACVVCREGTALTCDICGQRACMAHLAVDAHGCTGSR